jgi:gamma-glutamylputrescine oxidase
MELSSETALTAHSYYEASVKRPLARAALVGDVDCDVCIVGGGLAGLSAAIELRHKGFRVVVLEAKQIGWGASGRNGGQVIAGLACDIAVVERQLGRDAAKRVWEMSLEAIDIIHERRRRYNIACDWQAGFLHAAVKPRKARELIASIETLHRDFGYEHSLVEGGDVRAWIDSPRFVALAHDPRSGHLHPLKYTLGMAAAAEKEGAILLENTAATAVSRTARGAGEAQRNLVHTRDGAVRCNYVLLAGNVYLDRVAPSIRSRIMPVGTYIVATEPMPRSRANALIPSRSAVCDTNFVLDYFRLSADDRVIFGGRVSYSTMTPPNLVPSMRARTLAVFPQLADVKITHSWGGFVDITMNRAPDFGRLPELGKDVYYLQGFSGHGLALTGLAGRVAAEAIAGTAERFDVFARLKHRDFPGGRWLRTPALVAAMAWFRMQDFR